MSIGVICNRCRTRWHVPAAYAGRDFLCLACGAAIPIPLSAAATQLPAEPDPAPAPSQNPADSPQEGPIPITWQPSRTRSSTVRSCFVAAAIFALIGTCAGGQIMHPLSQETRFQAAEILIKGLASAGFYGFAVAYLLCGIYMRRNALVPVIFALVMTALSELASLLLFILVVYMFIILPPISYTGVLLEFLPVVLMAFAVGAWGYLLVGLIRILCEPRSIQT